MTILTAVEQPMSHLLAPARAQMLDDRRLLPVAFSVFSDYIIDCFRPFIAWAMGHHGGSVYYYSVHRLLESATTCVLVWQGLTCSTLPVHRIECRPDGCSIDFNS